MLVSAGLRTFQASSSPSICVRALSSMSRSQENNDKLTPTHQGVNSVTFHAPPLDQGLSVPQLYEYNARNSPDHPVFCYANIDTGIVHDITYSVAWDYICSTAKIVRSRLSDAKGPS